jgi:hypothetical protein
MRVAQAIALGGKMRGASCGRSRGNIEDVSTADAGARTTEGNAALIFMRDLVFTCLV